MRMGTSGRWTVAAATLLRAACGFEAPAPTRTPPPAPPPVPVSTLTATLTLPAAEAARRLNAETASRIAELRDKPVKCGIGRCRLNLEAVRTGPIAVEARHDAIEVALPFAVEAELSLPGFLKGVHAKANARGEALTATTLAIGGDWRLHPTTSGTIRLDDSHLRLGPVVTSLRDVWNDNDELLSKPLFKMLDQKIAADVRAEPKIAQLWRQALAPIKVSKKPAAWLVLAPERLRIGRPATANGAFVLSLGLEARAHVIVQDDPPKTEPTRPPPPAPLAGHDNRFAVSVPVLLPYDRAAALALDSLAKKPPHIAGTRLRFTRLAILPSGRDVILAARFCADESWDVFHWFSACGTGYLRGVPVFDAASGTIRIRDVRYDIATQNIILGAAHALAGPELGRELESRLVFQVGNDIAKLQGQIAAALARPQGREVTIAGTLKSFGPVWLTWTKDGFVALFSAEGSVRTDIRL